MVTEQGALTLILSLEYKHVLAETINLTNSQEGVENGEQNTWLSFSEASSVEERLNKTKNYVKSLLCINVVTKANTLTADNYILLQLVVK